MNSRDVVLEVGSEHNTFQGRIRVDKREYTSDNVIIYYTNLDTGECDKANEPALYNRVYRYRKAKEREKERASAKKGVRTDSLESTTTNDTAPALSTKAQTEDLLLLHRAIQTIQLDVRELRSKDIETLQCSVNELHTKLDTILEILIEKK